uniref:Aminotransferase-like plant mobile domain-containing protein n=1 Tax=Fagus sylvatica TaxID=28930 RepID=A0A2N9G1F8_FAGSY
MASSSQRSARRHRGTLSDEGDPLITDEATVPRGRGDDGGGSSSDSESPEPLEEAGVLHSILISRSSNMFWDTEALRQLVRRWCPSIHTFFFAHGELTVTLKDVRNHWLLLILGDQDPAKVEFSSEELRIEAALVDYIRRKNTSLGIQAARFTPWMNHFKREENASIRRAAFVAYWLSKCVFATNASWLLMLSSGRLQFTAYCAHKVRRQFGFDQESWHLYHGYEQLLEGVDGCYGGVQKQWERRHFPSATGMHFSLTSSSFISCHKHHDYICQPPKFRLCGMMSRRVEMDDIWGRRTALTNTLTAKKGQSNRSKKREALSRDSPTKASKKKKTTAARASGSRGVKNKSWNPKTSTAPDSSSLPASTAMRKSTRSIVDSERRSKQRADTLQRVPLENLDGSSSSSDRTGSSGAAAEEMTIYLACLVVA